MVLLKPCLSQSDLSLAYIPGVAAPCLKIQKGSTLSFAYTSRGNLVGVITNGTAVLRLEPTFGGINLEDIKAPDCFGIEEESQTRSPSRSSTTTSTARP